MREQPAIREEISLVRNSRVISQGEDSRRRFAPRLDSCSIRWEEIILFAEIDRRPRPRNADEDETAKRNEQVFRIHFVTVLPPTPGGLLTNKPVNVPLCDITTAVRVLFFARNFTRTANYIERESVLLSTDSIIFLQLQYNQTGNA